MVGQAPSRMGGCLTRWQRALARVCLYGGTALLLPPMFFCHVMTAPARLPLRSVSAGYEQKTIASDGLRLRGWFAHGLNGMPAAVVVPGLGDSIESYETVGGILRREGYSVLLLDLRAHGGSEGNRTTLGDH